MNEFDWYVTDKGKIRPIRWYHRLWWKVVHPKHGIYEFRGLDFAGNPLYFCKAEEKWIARLEGDWYLEEPCSEDSPWEIKWHGGEQ